MGMNSNDEINELKAEIVRLNDKICVMRSLLWEWNCTSDNVWEYYRLKQVGERDIDYAFLVNEDEPDMPLFDEDDRDFMERL
jgi:hypothetical protein